MPKRSSKRREDPNQLAARILAEVTQSAADSKEKNPAAVALGRMGGLKGGKARAKALSKEQRSAIAAKAAKTRWAKK